MFDIKAWVIGMMEANGLATGDADELGTSEKYGGPKHEGLIARMVESVGGEGEGDHRHVVYVVVPEGNFNPLLPNGRIDGAVGYFRINGYYESYNGTEWDSEVYVVEPEEVTVIQYN